MSPPDLHAQSPILLCVLIGSPEYKLESFLLRSRHHAPWCRWKHPRSSCRIHRHVLLGVDGSCLTSFVESTIMLLGVDGESILTPLL